ncbi:uncharacterized protein [Mytilus edulis]|uniref:uncharacterized protein isoform X2 n=1 Tax=Mytilus edulis TaxID=6550 RepID=UPI0039F087A0
MTDGGWNVCHDKPYRPPVPCLVYSFGINNDFSFDDFIVKPYGCDVHSFDPRATTAREFLPRPQPTAFRVLANATSRLLLTFKTAADARPKALREKFLFLDAEKNFTELFEKVYRRNSYCNTSGI